MSVDRYNTHDVIDKDGRTSICSKRNEVIVRVHLLIRSSVPDLKIRLTASELATKVFPIGVYVVIADGKERWRHSSEFWEKRRYPVEYVCGMGYKLTAHWPEIGTISQFQLNLKSCLPPERITSSETSKRKKDESRETAWSR